MSALEPTQIREWAKTRDIQAKDRGRVSAEQVVARQGGDRK
jgi:hypothetical protein